MGTEDGKRMRDIDDRVWDVAMALLTKTSYFRVEDALQEALRQCVNLDHTLRLGKAGLAEDLLKGGGYKP